MTDLENTKARPGPLDAFETAKPDEPIFTLQGGDPLAAPLVRQWAHGARKLATDIMDQQLRPWDKTLPMPPEATELLLRATSAEEVSWAMDAYRKNQPLNSDVSAAHSQTLDAGSTVASTSENVDATEKLLRHRKHNAAHDSISNCVALLTEARNTLRELDLTTCAVQLDNLLPALKNIERDSAPMRRPYVAP